MKKTRFWSPFFIVLILFTAAIVSFAIGAIDYAPLKQEEKDAINEGSWEKLKAKVHVESDIKMCTALIDDTHRSYRKILVPFINYENPESNKDIEQYMLVIVPAVDLNILNTMVSQTAKWSSERLNPDYSTSSFAFQDQPQNNEKYLPLDPKKYVMSTYHISGVTRAITEEEKVELYDKLVGKKFTEEQLNSMVNGIVIEYRDDSKYNFCTMIAVFFAVATLYSFYLAKEYAKNEESADPFAPKKHKKGSSSSYVSSSETSFAKKAAKQEAKKAARRETANKRAEEEARRRAAREEFEAEKEKYVVKQINRDSKNNQVSVTTSETSSITKKEETVRTVELFPEGTEQFENTASDNVKIMIDGVNNKTKKKKKYSVEKTKKTDKPVSPEELTVNSKTDKANSLKEVSKVTKTDEKIETKDISGAEKPGDRVELKDNSKVKKADDKAKLDNSSNSVKTVENVKSDMTNKAKKTEIEQQKLSEKQTTLEKTNKDDVKTVFEPKIPENVNKQNTAEPTVTAKSDKKAESRSGIIIGNVTNNEGKQTSEHRVGISLGPISSYGVTKKDKNSGIPSLPGFDDDNNKK